MPELPDVETFRRYLNSTALHQRVQAVCVKDGAVLGDTSAKSLQARLQGHEFKSTRRHGKNLFVEISGGSEWLRLHFGMTGSLVYLKDTTPPPAHAHVLFEFSHRHRLAYMDPRKLGAVGLVDNIADYAGKKHLGPDALGVSGLAFCARLEGRRGGIKAALMNQQVIAGLGNVYADELLFHSRTHPKVRIENLDRAVLKRLYRTMQVVLKKAVECRADVGRLPYTWLLPHRGRDGKCPRCGHGWKLIKVSSRTTYLCPACQKHGG